MKRMATLICVLALAGIVRAEDKPNPTGTWKYTAEVNGQSIEVTIKLKLEGDKLTGTVSVLDMESNIEDGKYHDGEVSFKVNREMNGNKFTIKYKGKIKGDTFKGKSRARTGRADQHPRVRGQALQGVKRTCPTIKCRSARLVPDPKASASDDNHQVLSHTDALI